MLVLEAVLYVFTGLLAGAVGGLLGVGGGIVLIPVLTLFFGHPIHLAIAVSLANSAAVAVSGSLRYYRQNLLQVWVIRYLIPTAVMGALIGSVVANRLPQRILMLIFSIYLFFVIIQLTLNLHPTGDRTRPGGLAVTGALTGFTSALLGIGGGSIAVPFQLLSGVSLKNAIANSLSTIMVSATAGAIAFFIIGGGVTFDVPRALFVTALVLPAGIIGAQLGSILTGRLPVVWVRLMFIIFVAIGAISMLRDALGI